MNFSQDLSYFDNINIRYSFRSSENTVQSGFDHTPSRRNSEIMINSSNQDSHQSNDSETYEQEIIESSRIANKEDLKCVLEEINCTICYHIVQNVVQCSICEAIYCKICIDRWQYLITICLKRVCPSCRRDSSDLPLRYAFLQKNYIDFDNPPSIMTTKVSQILKKILSKVKLYCKNQMIGCEDILNYEIRDKHECEYEIIQCPNDDCEESLMRKEFPDHRQVCLFEPLECRFCSCKYPRKYFENHINNCLKRLISCKWCHDKFELCSLQEHEEECPLREIICDLCQKTFRQERYRKHTDVVCLKQLLKIKEEQELKTYLQTQKIIEDLKSLNQMLKEENQLYKDENQLLRDENFILKCQAAINTDDLKLDKESNYSLDFEAYEGAIDEQSIKEQSIQESISEDIQETTDNEKIDKNQIMLIKSCNLFEMQTYTHQEEQEFDLYYFSELFKTTI